MQSRVSTGGALARLALSVARRPWAGAIVAFLLDRCAWLLPLKYYPSDPKVISFDHPRPMSAVHVLIVPRQRVSTLLALLRSPQADLLADVLMAAEDVTQRRSTDGVIVINGGIRQEVHQLHAHVLIPARLPDVIGRGLLENLHGYHLEGETQPGGIRTRLVWTGGASTPAPESGEVSALGSGRVGVAAMANSSPSASRHRISASLANISRRLNSVWNGSRTAPNNKTAKA